MNGIPPKIDFVSVVLKKKSAIYDCREKTLLTVIDIDKLTVN